MKYLPDNQDPPQKEADWDAEEIMQQAQKMQELKETIKKRHRQGTGEGQAVL